MRRLLTTLLFLPLECLVSIACLPTDYQNVTGSSGELLLTQQYLNFSCQRLDTVTFRVMNQVKVLDLSSNRIQELPQEFLKSAQNLESLFLHNNKLKFLPAFFFVNTRHLKKLSLEKNQLVSIPTEDFPDCLEMLSVDCTCNVTGSIFKYCNDCMLSGIKCQCFSSGELMNANDYYSSSCHQVKSSLYPAIVAVLILVLILLAILACLLIWRKRGAIINHEKRASKTSEGTPVQPRYISHLSPPGSAFQDAGCHKDYENIYSNQNKGEVSNQNKKQPKRRSPSNDKNTDGSQGDQPIYANDQGVYYNYPGKPLQEAVDEEIYIIPDQ